MEGNTQTYMYMLEKRKANMKVLIIQKVRNITKTNPMVSKKHINNNSRN